MCAYDNILEIIKNGYKIPFYSLSKRCFQKNNNSALLHNEFNKMAILKLIENGQIEECFDIPFIVNPLTVSVQLNGNRDLKQSVKYEEFRTASVFVKIDSFMFSFDLYVAYHHVEMFYPHTEFLGFSWVVNDKQRFSKFSFMAPPI